MARAFPLDFIRNIGLLGTQDAGRTTTTERLLAVAGRVEGAQIHGTGRAAGDNVVDLASVAGFDASREITTTSGATSLSWQGRRVTIVETVGDLPHLLSALDGLVLVVSGMSGLGEAARSLVQTSEESGLPRILFVNKLDGAGADLDRVVAGLANVGTVQPVLLQLPLGGGLSGLIDLVEMRASFWRGSRFGAAPESGAIPEEFAALAAGARARLLAALELGSTAEVLEVRAALRAAVLGGRVLPVLCGSAFRGRGIEDLLDAIVSYLPSPADRAAIAVQDGSGTEVLRPTNDDEPFTGLAFRTVAEPVGGALTFLRIFSGGIAAGATVLNAVNARPELISRMVRIHANHVQDIGEAWTGDIVALGGLAHTATGDTLCDPNSPVVLDRKPHEHVSAPAGRAAY